MNKYSLFEQWSTLMVDTFGANAPLLIAYTVAAAHREALLTASKGFPLLLVQGNRATGKSVMSRAVVAPLIPNLRDQQDGYLMERRLLRPLNDYIGQGAPIVWLNEFVNRQPKRVAQRLIDLYNVPVLPAAVICCNSRYDMPLSLAKCGIDMRLVSTDWPASCSRRLQELRAFELGYGQWLKPDADVAARLPNQYPETLSWLEACWHKTGWQRQPDREEQIAHLAVLCTAVECWIAMGYLLPFSPDELVRCYVRHNLPYAHHSAS